MSRTLNFARNQIKAIIFDDPRVRVAVPIGSGILSNVFAGSFVFDITKSVNGMQVLAWSYFYQSPSFWILTFIFASVAWYSRATHVFERDLRAHLDPNFLLAFLNRETMPAFIKKAKDDIANGRISSFSDLKSFIGDQ